MLVERRLESFGGYTTMHGFSRIVESKAKPRRIVWIIVFSTAWILFAVQISFLLKHYFEYQKQVSTDLELGGAPFPAITLCNLGSFDFHSIYRLTKSVPSLRKHYDQNNSASYEAVDEDHDDDDDDDDGDYDYYGEYSAKDEEIRRTVADANETFATVLAKFYNMIDFNFQSSSLPDGDWWEIVTRMFSRSSIAANVPHEMLEANGVQENEFIVKCTYKKKRCTMKWFFDPYFFNCFTFTPNNTLDSGHQPALSQGIDSGFSVMVLSGSRMLKDEETVADYNLPGLYAKDSVLSGAAGVRVVIHPPGTKPFPLSEGYDVPPGMMASLGVSPKQRTRLGQPWGHCSDEFSFLSPEEKKLSGPYRRTACEKVCIQKHIYEKCKCHENNLPTASDLLTKVGTVRETSRPICASDFKYVPRDRCRQAVQTGEEIMQDPASQCQRRVEKCSGPREFRKCFKVLSAKDANCSDAVMKKLLEKMRCSDEVQEQVSANETKFVECGCHPSCNEIHYDTSYSLSQWPSQGLDGDSVYYEIFDEIKFDMRFACAEKKRLYREYAEMDKKRALKDFSKINVYISDANVLVTKESPAMTRTQLVSDIGGQLGVWIGVSVITIAEVVEMVVLIITDYCRKREKKQKDTGLVLNDTAA